MAVILGADTGGSQINEVVILNAFENTVTLADGRVYQKAGVIETTTSNYPDARVSFLPTGDQIDTTGVSSPQGVAWDGTYYWVTDGNSDDVTKLDTSGASQATFSVSSQDTQPTGITWDGSYLWVAGSQNDRVYKYNNSGTYQNSYFDISSQTTGPVGLTWDGSYLWLIGNNEVVYKYNTSGTYQNVSFSVASQTSYAQGIAWDGTSFWVIDGDENVWEYNASGVYQNNSFSAAASTNEATGIVWNGAGSKLVVLSNQYDDLFDYVSGVGIAEITDNQKSYGAQLGGNVYVRVK